MKDWIGFLDMQSQDDFTPTSETRSEVWNEISLLMGRIGSESSDMTCFIPIIIVHVNTANDSD